MERLSPSTTIRRIARGAASLLADQARHPDAATTASARPIPSGLHHRACATFAVMCRNIKTLFNFEPPATDDEVRAAALQFVRKLSGFNAPSKQNEAAFSQAVDDVAAIANVLLASLSTTAPPRDRQVEAQKARERSKIRFGRVTELAK